MFGSKAPNGSEWFLFTERVSLFGGASKHDAQHQEVILRQSGTGVGSFGTVWHFQYFNPQLRLEVQRKQTAFNCPCSHSFTLFIITSGRRSASTRKRPAHSDKLEHEPLVGCGAPAFRKVGVWSRVLSHMPHALELAQGRGCSKPLGCRAPAVMHPACLATGGVGSESDTPTCVAYVVFVFRV